MFLITTMVWIASVLSILFLVEYLKLCSLMVCNIGSDEKCPLWLWTCEFLNDCWADRIAKIYGLVLGLAMHFDKRVILFQAWPRLQCISSLYFRLQSSLLWQVVCLLVGPMPHLHRLMGVVVVGFPLFFWRLPLYAFWLGILDLLQNFCIARLQSHLDLPSSVQVIHIHDAWVVVADVVSPWSVSLGSSNGEAAFRLQWWHHNCIARLVARQSSCRLPFRKICNPGREICPAVVV